MNLLFLLYFICCGSQIDWIIFENLPRNTPNRLARYASLEAFREEFLRLADDVPTYSIKNLDELLDDFEHFIVKFE